MRKVGSQTNNSEIKLINRVQDMEKKEPQALKTRWKKWIPQSNKKLCLKIRHKAFRKSGTPSKD